MSTESSITDTSSGPVLSFENIYMGFGDKNVLSGLTFSVQPRESKVFIGESGSGKTIALKLAAGLLRPDSGTIRVLGQDLATLTEEHLLDFRRQIGFVFQEGALFDSLSVEDNVAYRLREQHVDEDEIDQRVLEVLHFVEMQDAIGKLPGELSGGMRRRVSIARALANRPSVVFYDSPTAGLDPVTSQTIITLILRLRDTQGVTSLIATHRLQDAFGLANYQFDGQSGHVIHLGRNGTAPEAPSAPTNLLVLRGGKAYFEGSPEAIATSSDAYLKRFLL
jgi:phospholipid/cholesterol/gamma-HCH transport system ATP-binding protein